MIIMKPTDTAPLDNPELKLAMDFVQHTGSHVFLTGKAGTGKTTFLSGLKKATPKRMVITAPTGVAAINAGGVTLHSFFQLPFGPFIPGTESTENYRKKSFGFSREKKQIMQNLDLLVIDEISMVRADLLDAVDAALRRHRRNQKPFGGVQLLLIGDLHQLSPVAKQEEWKVLQSHYDSAYFFSSHALNQTKIVTIELKHIYRQSDARFITLLNRVRENRLDPESVAQLNQRYIPTGNSEAENGAITLTTHNSNADTINSDRLKALPGKEFRFMAEVTGEFPEHSFPVPATLVLKTGAQVMFLRNDASAEKQYFNGKIGKITAISGERIRIACPGEKEEISIEPVEWENIKYTVTEDGKDIREEIIGKLKQFPLKPAWAITIHKSQGLTFDRAVIDARSAFAPGQFYVALSRCRTIEGLELRSPMPERNIGVDETVLRFIKTAGENMPSENQLLEEKIAYQQHLLLDCFDFQPMANYLNSLCRLLSEHGSLIHAYGVSDMNQLKVAARKEIILVADKFSRQLKSIFPADRLPETDTYLQERIGKASAWFEEKLTLVFADLLQKFQIESDNKEIRKRVVNSLSQLKLEIHKKLAGIRSCEGRFSPSAYLRAVSDIESEFSAGKQKHHTPDYGESDITHPEVFQQLKDWRSRKAKERNVPHYQVLHQRTLVQIAVHLPGNPIELKQIKGVGKETVNSHGKEILDLISAYRKEKGIEAVFLPEVKPGKNEAKPTKKPAADANTRRTSFDLFNRGLTVAEIARERSLAITTIEGHLASFVEKGELDINRLLSEEKKAAIEAVMAAHPENSLKTIKGELGEGFTYSDILFVKAFRKFSGNQTPHGIL